MIDKKLNILILGSLDWIVIAVIVILCIPFILCFMLFHQLDFLMKLRRFEKEVAKDIEKMRSEGELSVDDFSLEIDIFLRRRRIWINGVELTPYMHSYGHALSCDMRSFLIEYDLKEEQFVQMLVVARSLDGLTQKSFIHFFNISYSIEWNKNDGAYVLADFLGNKLYYGLKSCFSRLLK